MAVASEGIMQSTRAAPSWPAAVGSCLMWSILVEWPAAGFYFFSFSETLELVTEEGGLGGQIGVGG
jgi:hypothetical protein